MAWWKSLEHRCLKTRYVEEKAKICGKWKETIQSNWRSVNSLRLIEQNVQIFCNLSRWIRNCRVGRVGSNNVRLVKSHSRSAWRLWGMKFPSRDWCLWILKLLNTRFQSTDIVLQNLNFGSFLAGCVFTVFNSRSTIALTAEGLLAITSLQKDQKLINCYSKQWNCTIFLLRQLTHAPPRRR
jgi:hypothetical protein